MVCRRELMCAWCLSTVIKNKRWLQKQPMRGGSDSKAPASVGDSDDDADARQGTRATDTDSKDTHGAADAPAHDAPVSIVQWERGGKRLVTGDEVRHLAYCHGLSARTSTHELQMAGLSWSGRKHGCVGHVRPRVSVH